MCFGFIVANNYLTFYNSFYSQDEIIYILLELFSFLSFAFTSFVISKSKYKKVIFKKFEINILYCDIFSLYTIYCSNI